MNKKAHPAITPYYNAFFAGCRKQLNYLGKNMYRQGIIVIILFLIENSNFQDLY